MSIPKPVVLMILDGWGIHPDGPGNAVSQARTPALDSLFADYPHTRLKCSGTAVGLPEGIMGNSEVGHLNIGAGRIVYQDLLRIDLAIKDGSFFEIQAFRQAMDQALELNSAVHLIGLLSDGGVHSSFDHLLALLDLTRAKGLRKVYVHAILDGRDTPPDSGRGYVFRLQEFMAHTGHGAIASICGRYYALDRDTRWDRTEIAYRLLTQAEGTPALDPVAAVAQAYGRGETDEFVKPVIITDSGGRPRAVMQANDAVIFFNFRADRARQLTRAFTDDAFDGFARKVRPRFSAYVCMASYDEAFKLPTAFPPERLTDILGEVLSRNGLCQLRIAETEKYAHVTYFFNGGEEQPFENEERCMIPSPRDVPTYDHKPEMSARAVTEEVLRRLAEGSYDLIVINFANMDMVGHTGNLTAAITACETVDGCVERIVNPVREAGGALIITADHGNAEMMINGAGKIHTAHTTHPVPLVLVSDALKQARLKEGALCDIAPTILRLMGLAQPEQMTGRVLIMS